MWIAPKKIHACFVVVRYMIQGTRYMVQGTWYKVHGTRYMYHPHILSAIRVSLHHNVSTKYL